MMLFTQTYVFKRRKNNCLPVSKSWWINMEFLSRDYLLTYLLASDRDVEDFATGVIYVGHDVSFQVPLPFLCWKS